jgi:hypothetical protein
MSMTARLPAWCSLLALVACGGTVPADDDGELLPYDDASAPSADAGRDARGGLTQPDATAAHDASPADSGVHDATIADAGHPDAAPVDAGLDAGPFATAGADTTVTAFDGTLVCFGSGGVGPCSRTVDRTVAFPATGAFSKIQMHVTLNCPSNGCDPWDRVGTIALVKPGAGGDTLIELGRFMTPYGIRPGVNNPPAWDIDVTELRPLLAGSVTLRVFIDTWVPQGDAPRYGGGWVVGTKFEMKGGFAAKAPLVVLPIWTWKTTGKEPTQVVYGDARWPIDSSVPPQSIALPSGPTSWGIRSIITGHGQANLDNCAEFCSRVHSWKVGNATNKKTVWRTDCGNFPSSGTFQYPRAGWCPGAAVIPWDVDVTGQVNAASGALTTFTYGVDAYVNTCNDKAPGGPLCSGCAQGAPCGYNGGSHTQPFYYLSSVLVGFR